MRRRPARVLAAALAFGTAVGTVLGTAACGSSSPGVVRPGTGSAPAATTSSAPGPRSSSPTAAAHQTMTVVPRLNLRSGTVVRIRAAGFTPGEPLQLVQCAAKGQATTSGDCNLAGMTPVTADAQGGVQASLQVVRGPFGANRIVCSEAVGCLVSLTQASLSPTEEVDVPITFAP